MASLSNLVDGPSEVWQELLMMMMPIYKMFTLME